MQAMLAKQEVQPPMCNILLIYVVLHDYKLCREYVAARVCAYDAAAAAAGNDDDNAGDANANANDVDEHV